MAKHWKILGLSLLALIGVLAVNASAAQAKWLILVELSPGVVSSVKELKLKGSREGSDVLTENGNQLHCNGATGTGVLALSEEDKKMSGTATVTFTGCTEEQFPGTCTLHSTGQPNGTIVASGSEIAYMKGEEVYFKTASSNFTTLEYLGEECPLNETKEVIAGALKITLSEPLSLRKLHEIGIHNAGLKLGSSNVEVHMKDPVTKELLQVILGSIEEISGRPFSFHLCNLPGAPVC